MKQYLKRISSFRIASWVALIFLGFLFLSIARGWLESDVSKLLVELLGGLVSAYFGASAAIGFQEQKDKEQKLRLDTETINMAIVSLVRRLNYVLQVQLNLGDTEREVEKRHVQIRAFLLVPPDEQLNFTTLFAALGSDGARALEDTMLADASYRTVVESLNRRALAHKAMHSRLAEHGVEGSYEGTEAEFRQMIGIDIWYDLKSNTDGLIEATNSAAERLNAAIDVVRQAASKRFPETRFLEFEETGVQ